MAIESVVGTVMSVDGTDGIGKAAGVSEEATRGVLTAALPLLLGGALSQSNHANTAAGFAGALSQHAASNTSDVGAFMSGVDMKDGEKIVDHLLGSSSKDVVAEIAKKTGVKKSDVKKVLAASAPLLMSLLGKEVNSQQQQQPNNNAGVAGIMGSLLGGGGSASASLLTGLLGGGAQQQQQTNNAAGGLGSLLMGLLK